MNKTGASCYRYTCGAKNATDWSFMVPRTAVSSGNPCDLIVECVGFPRAPGFCLIEVVRGYCNLQNSTLELNQKGRCSRYDWLRTIYLKLKVDIRFLYRITLCPGRTSYLQNGN